MNLTYSKSTDPLRQTLSAQDVCRAIARGELRVFDRLVTQNGIERPAIEFAPFLETFKQTARLQLQDKNWLVLRAVNQGNPALIGPVGVERLLELLQKGKLSGNDFVWRSGYKAWRPLRELTEFTYGNWLPNARLAGHDFVEPTLPVTLPVQRRKSWISNDDIENLLLAIVLVGGLLFLGRALWPSPHQSAATMARAVASRVMAAPRAIAPRLANRAAPRASLPARTAVPRK